MQKKINARFLLCLFSALFLWLCIGGCGAQSPEIGEYPVVINGKEVAAHPEKVVSLSPACTAYALQKGYSLYGVSSGCAQWIPAVKDYPDFGSALSPNLQRMKEEGVDMVLSASKLLESDQEKLKQEGISYVELTPPEDLLGLVAWYSDIGGVFAGSLGQQDGADTAALVVEEVQRQAMEKPASDRPVTLLCFSEDLSHSVPDSGFLGYLFTLFDFENISSESGLTDPEQLLLQEPDYLLVGSEQLYQELQENQSLNSLEAVKQGRVYVIDLSPLQLFLPQTAEQTQAFLKLLPLTDA